MQNQLNLMIATTLSMIMTFVLYCNLKETSANDFYFQRIVIDRIRDYLLYARCRFNSPQETCEYLLIIDDNIEIVWSRRILLFIIILLAQFNVEKNLYYLRLLTRTIYVTWFIVRFLNSIPLSYPSVDVFTVYFLLWQYISLHGKWIYRKLPFFSTTIYRGYLCLLMGLEAFFIYDFIFRYLPEYVQLALLWMMSVLDIFLCLHPKGYLYTNDDDDDEPFDTLSSSASTYVIEDCYVVNDFDDYETNDGGTRESLGLGDFFFYNLMLLWILPSLSSMTTKLCITIGHIISVQIGLQATIQLGCLFNQRSRPALPLPVLTVSIYAFLLHLFNE